MAFESLHHLPSRQLRYVQSGVYTTYQQHSFLLLLYLLLHLSIWLLPQQQINSSSKS